MVLSVLRKLILQTRMRGHPVGLDVLFFVHFHTSCVRTAKAGETAWDAQARLSHRWDSRLYDKYQNLFSWLKFHSNQDSPKTGDHSYVGPSPNQYGPPVWRKPRGAF